MKFLNDANNFISLINEIKFAQRTEYKTINKDAARYQPYNIRGHKKIIMMNSFAST